MTCQTMIPIKIIITNIIDRHRQKHLYRTRQKILWLIKQTMPQSCTQKYTQNAQTIKFSKYRCSIPNSLNLHHTYHPANTNPIANNTPYHNNEKLPILKISGSGDQTIQHKSIQFILPKNTHSQCVLIQNFSKI